MSFHFEKDRHLKTSKYIRTIETRRTFSDRCDTKFAAFRIRTDDGEPVMFHFVQTNDTKNRINNKIKSNSLRRATERRSLKC